MVLSLSRKKPPDLLVAGVSTVSDDYPNVKYKLAWLKGLPDYRVADKVHDLASTDSFWSTTGQQSGWRKLWLALRITFATLTVFAATLYSRAPRVYIVYPSLPLAICLAVVPARWRPQLMLDGFISLYDTVVNDRGLLDESAWLARVLFALERFSFARASAVIVDTQQNAEFYAELFELPLSRFAVSPLAIPPAPDTAATRLEQDRPLKVVFFGSLVPLQGVATVVQVIERMQHETWLEFELIGDGQQADLVAALADLKPANFHWQRRWLSTPELAARIATAHVTLGVFAARAKTARVIPYKIYYYLSQGKPCISARTPAMVDALGSNDSVLTLVDPESSDQIIAALRRLYDQRQEIPRLQREARTLFDEALGPQQWQSRMREILFERHGLSE